MKRKLEYLELECYSIFFQRRHMVVWHYSKFLTWFFKRLEMEHQAGYMHFHTENVESEGAHTHIYNSTFMDLEQTIN
jgi:hypothetical protein